MSLSVALQSALSGMQAAQAALLVVAGNAANVNTDGYSRKVVEQQTRIVNGNAAGVRLSKITRIVDQNLVDQVRLQLSAVSNLEVRDQFFARTQQLFGSLADDSSLSHRLTELGTAFDSLAATPESIAARAQVVSLGQQLTAELRRITDVIQDARQEADAEISRLVTAINEKLTLIDSLNRQVSSARALGLPSGDLEDQRDHAISALAANLDIRTFARQDGQTAVFTTSGRPLVDGFVNQLSHTAASQLSAGTTYLNGINGIIFGVGGPDITAESGGGRIGALISMRDQTLVDLQAEIDRLAESLSDEVNKLHNAGTAYPPPASLTGSRTVGATDTPTMTGNFRVAATSPTGVIVESLTINLATLVPPTIGQLVTTINGMANATAVIDAQGKVVIAPTGLSRIAVGEETGAVTTGSKTTGMAQFLGLNDFFVSGEAFNAYASDRTASSTTALGLAGTLTINYPGGSTPVAYTAGQSLTTIATNISAALAAQNITATVRQEGAGFRVEISDSDGDNFFIADSASLVSTLNLRSGVPGDAGRIAVHSNIIANADSVASGALAGSSPISIGDGSTAQAIAAMFNGTVSIAGAGGLATLTTSLTDYGANILSRNAVQTEAVTRQLSVTQGFHEALKARAAGISAVNLDEEMSNMIVLQNAFNASARVTSIVSEMMDVLVNIIR